MSAELSKDSKERLIQVKLSVAVFAFCGNLADYVNTRVLLVTDREGKVSPVAGKVEKGEHPLSALKREWHEETGGEPFEFETRSLEFSDSILVENKEYTDIGYIFTARLTDEQIEIFDEGKTVEDDEDIVSCRLFDMDEIINILKNWEKSLAHPEINAQTLINLLNNVLVNHDTSVGEHVTNDDLFTLEFFGMDFKTNSLSLRTLEL